jgi:ketosteroid isomerase-like protein
MRRLLWLVLLFPAVLLAQAQMTPEAVLRAFTEAGNRGDVEAMLGWVEDDVRWLHVAGPAVQVEVEGKANLREWLASYYASTPEARSALGPIAWQGRVATTVETASWRAADGRRRAQAAPLVVAFSERGRIATLWYFPSQPVSP